MLVSLSNQLNKAKKGGYAVGLFNVVTPQMLHGVFRAAKDTSSPLIIGCAEVMTQFISLEELSSLALPMIKKADFPVTLHFDHAHSPSLIKKAIELGFNSVMYDCSEMTFEENCKNLKQMAQYAHSRGACIEAELGRVAGIEGEEGANFEDYGVFTPPDKAKKFTEITGADALAVSIGNAHGAYNGKPKLRFDILSEIAKKVDIPLVLHGGSGIPEADFRRAISMGISKVNIFTDINIAAARAAADAYREGTGFTKLIFSIEQAVYDVAKERMLFFKNEEAMIHNGT